MLSDFASLFVDGITLDCLVVIAGDGTRSIGHLAVAEGVVGDRIGRCLVAFAGGATHMSERLRIEVGEEYHSQITLRK